jgi:hypothetical protein
MPETGIGGRCVAIERNRRLVFGNGVRVSVLLTQQLALGPMGKRGVGRYLTKQAFGAGDVGGGGVAHLHEYTVRERGRQPDLSLGRPWVER